MQRRIYGLLSVDFLVAFDLVRLDQSMLFGLGIKNFPDIDELPLFVAGRNALFYVLMCFIVYMCFFLRSY
jgi:hypothetical protein